jgi:Ca-activated chloride channel family protein
MLIKEVTMKALKVLTTISVLAIAGCTVREASQPGSSYNPKAPVTEAELVKSESGALLPAEAPAENNARKQQAAQPPARRPHLIKEKSAGITAMVSDEYTALAPAPECKKSLSAAPKCLRAKMRTSPAACVAAAPQYYPAGYDNTEEYNTITENAFKQVRDDPLSTFSIDVDKASYGNIRRFFTANTLPPRDAVRIEEMINYFTYDYPAPEGADPFSITTDVGTCPWATDHQLVLIGLQGKRIAAESMPPSNIVFLLDVSGSMDSPDKLPLVQMAMKLLVEQLRPQDKVAIAVYAGSAGLVLPSTRGDRKSTIINAIDDLSAGGSTAGSEGIDLAYTTARSNFIKGGNNRVILATDGDFNVGPSSDGELVRIIEEKRKQGIFLTVLGVGTGNYKDAKMEQLADKGNGNYAYIDNLLEAKKVLVNEMGGTLLTIAKDVKIQIEFNPEHVSAYRLIGYENRALANQDFNDDTKDAGELGSGHTVTALYELIPSGSNSLKPSVDPLKYQSVFPIVKELRSVSDELLTVKFRYKKPDEEESRKIEKIVYASKAGNASDNLAYAAAVAGFGMLLRDSQFKGNLTYGNVINLARKARGNDVSGNRSECIKMMEQAQMLAGRLSYSKE